MTLVTIVHRDKTVLIPLIFNFKTQIKKHILIYDNAKSDIKYANELKSGIQKLWEKYSLDSVPIEMISIDEDSRNDLSRVIEKLSTEDRLYLNGAEADISVLILLSNHILSIGGVVLAYDKDDNSYNLITKDGFENLSIKESMSIEDFLILMSEELIEETPKRSIWEKKDALMTIFEDAKQMFKVRKYLIDGKLDEVKKSYPDIYKALSSLEYAHTIESIKQNSSLGGFGLFFEQFVFLHMSRFDFDDIKCGVKILFEKDSTNSSNPAIVANEFDILTIKDNRIGIVECKIGNRVDTVNTIYKNDAIMDYFGDNSKSMIVNIQPNTPSLVNGKLNFSDSVILRANTKRIDIFNAFDLGKRKFTNALKQTFRVKQRHFLLGSSNLEMAAIKNILQKTGQIFTDRKLSEDAKLSNYQDLINDTEHFFAINLDVDINPPQNFSLIKSSDKKSALEEVMDILDFPTDRFYTLISIYTKGSILALEKFGATTKEIENIVHLDEGAKALAKR